MTGFQIIFATGNQNKVREVREILEETPSLSGTPVISAGEAGLISDPEETGSTFEENALIKARALAALLPPAGPALDAFMTTHGLHPACPLVVLSDDSGLCIDALGGAPDILSARYLGRDTSYQFKMNTILDRMKQVPAEQRSARFVAAVAAVLPDGTDFVVRGTMEGRIGYAIAGTNGFGYDPFFYLPQFGKTSAEISPEQKNAISHRGQALRKALAALRQQFPAQAKP